MVTDEQKDSAKKPTTSGRELRNVRSVTWTQRKRATHQGWWSRRRGGRPDVKRGRVLSEKKKTSAA